MNEKYLAGFGAGLLLISFGVIVSFLVVTSVESKAMEENQTISFEQLADLDSTHKNLKNNPTSQEFRKFVGDTVDELKDKVVLENSTLYWNLKNSTVINGTD